jgi:hypothetical protein
MLALGGKKDSSLLAFYLAILLWDGYNTDKIFQSFKI